MLPDRIDYSLYVCTDRDLMSSQTIEESVEKALKGGAGIIQLREKSISGRDFYEEAKAVHEITKRYGVPLIINDRVDIALAIGAEGVHVGQSDIPCSAVRKIVGKDMLVGVSASSVEEAVKAVEDGADYLGVGAMNPTATKTDADSVTMEELVAIRKAVTIPIVIIGGINKETALRYKGLGIDGIAVVSAVVSSPDPEKSAKELKELWLS